MEQDFYNKAVTGALLTVLVILTFFVLKPILLSVIFAILLAFLFIPVYNWISKRVKSKNLSAIIISVFLILLIILPLWAFAPIMVDQSLKVYSATRQMDFATPLEDFFPSIFASKEFANEVGSIIYSFVNKTINSIVVSFSSLIVNFPMILMHLIVIAFTFFFVLRDKDEILDYIKSLLPFSKEIEHKLFAQTKGITISILYGQVVVGIIQGLIVGLGFFIFGVSNALLLTLFAALAGIFPIIGTTIVWLPVVIYLFAAGSTFSAMGVLIFGLIATFVDNILKPVIISKRTNIPTLIMLIGMVGGFFLFNIIGIIIGPLILAYLLIVLEIYRNKRKPGILLTGPPQRLRLNI